MGEKVKVVLLVTAKLFISAKRLKKKAIKGVKSEKKNYRKREGKKKGGNVNLYMLNISLSKNINTFSYRVSVGPKWIF